MGTGRWTNEVRDAVASGETEELNKIFVEKYDEVQRITIKRKAKSVL